MSTEPLHPEIRDILRCPACRSTLNDADDSLQCTSCVAKFPIVSGVPVLIDEQESLFTLEDYVRAPDRVAAQSSATERVSPIRRWKDAITRAIPDINENLSAARNYEKLAKILTSERAQPRVLVVGGREIGRGMREFLNVPSITLVETDIDFGPRSAMIADAHQIPFADGSFDAVIAQAVLEHVLDPYRCAEEIHRVLKPDGLVYAETPFLQRRHGGAFDFTRFTFLGHRRLFRRFQELDSGPAVGPGVALAWTYNGFLLSFSDRRPIRAGLRIFARLTSFWLKYFDRHLARNEGALDSASGFYFLGRRSEETLTDRELIRQFRGIA